MKLALLRHGMTDWNLEKRVQGRIDQPLSATGRQQFTETGVTAGNSSVSLVLQPFAVEPRKPPS